MTANRKVRLARGFLFHGIFAFTTTGTTKSIDLPFKRVHSVVVTPIGAYAAPDQLSVNATVTGTPGDDGAQIAGDGRVTNVVITRDAAGTSGLPFSLMATGE